MLVSNSINRKRDETTDVNLSTKNVIKLVLIEGTATSYRSAGIPIRNLTQSSGSQETQMTRKIPHATTYGNMGLPAVTRNLSRR